MAAARPPARQTGRTEGLTIPHHTVGSVVDSPQVTAADDARVFLEDLRRRINDGKLSLRAAAAKSGYAVSTISAALSSHKLPSPELLKALLAQSRHRKKRWTSGFSVVTGYSVRRTESLVLGTRRYPLFLPALPRCPDRPPAVGCGRLWALAATAGIAGTLLLEAALDGILPAPASDTTEPSFSGGMPERGQPAIPDYSEAYARWEEPVVARHRP
jgi:hypothetical protein